MRKRLVGCLWPLAGLCTAAVWILADRVTKNAVGQLNPFNDAVLILLAAGAVAVAMWENHKVKNKIMNENKIKIKNKKK